MVTLRGPKNDVDKAYKHLQSLSKDMVCTGNMYNTNTYRVKHENDVAFDFPRLDE